MEVSLAESAASRDPQMTNTLGPSAESPPNEIETLSPPPQKAGHDAATHDLKGRTMRGALISSAGQAATFVFRMCSMVVLARLLTPKDFGIVAMAMACTGFIALFQDVGLSTAAIQRPSISREQTSTLFWINLGAGALLAAFCAVTAPILARFYHEPRVLWVAAIIGTVFLFNGAAAQHRAMLQRNLRFAALTIIDVTSAFISIALGITMAATGCGYWALVGMAVAQPAASSIGVWLVGRWIPGRPRRGIGIGSMLKFGSTAMINNVIVYFAYNMDKVLLGRFWGAQVLGIYGRAYQLVNMPTQNLNTTITLVAFPALSRLQNQPERLRSYFLKGYGLYLALVMPITFACGIFGEDIIRVFLGPKWFEAVPVFRLLAPTILAFALINPFGWLLLATGRVVRGFKIGLMIAPVVVLGYASGLGYGATGVAIGFSVSISLLIVPVVIWATRGTPISAIDIFKTVRTPLLSILVASGMALASSSVCHLLPVPLLRLVAVSAVLFGVYAGMLWFVMGQKDVYLDLLSGLGVWPLSRWRGRNRKADREAQD